jgi:hypothetical protein
MPRGFTRLVRSSDPVAVARADDAKAHGLRF